MPRLALGPSISGTSERILVAWKHRVLVIASVTATSGELSDALRNRAHDASVAFTLIVPASPLECPVSQKIAQPGVLMETQTQIVDQTARAVRCGRS